MIDPQSELITNVIGNAVLFGAMVVYWRTQKTNRGFGMWTIATLVGGIFYLPFFLTGVVPDILAGGLASLLAMVLLPLYYEGLRAFYGAPSIHRSTLFLVGIAALLIVFFSTVDSSVALRNIIVLLVQIVFSVLSVKLLIFRHREDGALLRGALAAIAGAYAVALSARGVVWIMAPQGTILSSGFGNGVFFLISHLVHTVTVIFLLMLNGAKVASELKQSQKELELLATIDPMTGAYTRREFMDIVSLAVNASRRYAQPMCIMMFDIDRFKEINDNYGHGAGDGVLSQVVRIVHDHTRTADTIGRLGGDEFAVCFPQSSAAAVCRAAERIRLAICRTPLGTSECPIEVTVSIGVVQLVADDVDPPALLERADACLYESKRSGRNKITASDPAER